MCWDLRRALIGIYDDRDPWGVLWAEGSLRAQQAGKHFAGGLRGAVVVARADTAHQAPDKPWPSLPRPELPIFSNNKRDCTQETIAKKQP